MERSENLEVPKVTLNDEALNVGGCSHGHSDGHTDSFTPHARLFIVLISLFLMIFVVAVNGGILGVALPVSKRSSGFHKDTTNVIARL